MDVRKVVSAWSELSRAHTSKVCQEMPLPQRYPHHPSVGIQPTLRRRMSPNIESQLRFLDLAPFEGRQHCGIDVSLTVGIAHFCRFSIWHSPTPQDSRNIARIIIELARRGVRLTPNTPIQPGRRWPWMGKSGQILESYL
jgi:3'-5' exoribonuclease 1